MIDGWWLRKEKKPEPKAINGLVHYIVYGNGPRICDEKFHVNDGVTRSIARVTCPSCVKRTERRS